MRFQLQQQRPQSTLASVIETGGAAAYAAAERAPRGGDGLPVRAGVRARRRSAASRSRSAMSITSTVAKPMRRSCGTNVAALPTSAAPMNVPIENFR